MNFYIKGLAQYCSNSIANALELLQYYASPSIYANQNLMFCAKSADKALMFYLLGGIIIGSCCVSEMRD